jgi:hypothetical protein
MFDEATIREIARQLAPRVIDSAGAPSAATADWLHEALELWLFQLKHCQQGDSEATPQQVLANCLKRWEDLVKAMPLEYPLEMIELRPKARTAQQPAKTGEAAAAVASAALPPPPPSQGDAEFSLGSKRRRR